MKRLFLCVLCENFAPFAVKISSLKCSKFITRERVLTLLRLVVLCCDLLMGKSPPSIKNKRGLINVRCYKSAKFTTTERVLPIAIFKLLFINQLVC
jgi:hypothetical protein